MEFGGEGKGRFSRLSRLLLLHLAWPPLLCALKRAAGLLRESFRWIQVVPGVFQVHGGCWLTEPPVAGQSVLVVVGSRRGKGFRSKLEVWIMLGSVGGG